MLEPIPLPAAAPHRPRRHHRLPRRHVLRPAPATRGRLYTAGARATPQQGASWLGGAACHSAGSALAVGCPGAVGGAARGEAGEAGPGVAGGAGTAPGGSGMEDRIRMTLRIGMGMGMEMIGVGVCSQHAPWFGRGGAGPAGSAREGPVRRALCFLRAPPWFSSRCVTGTESVTPGREVCLMFPALLVLQPRGARVCCF